jgi:hypothetical protein
MLPSEIEPIRMSEWQTKTFDRHMEEYIIDQHSNLYKEVSHIENVPEKERIFYGKPEWELGDLYKLCGSQKKIIDSYIKSNYSGVLECHQWNKEKQKMTRLEITLINGHADNIEAYTT